MDNQGLTSERAGQLLKQHGPNELPRERTHVLRRVVRWIFSPISLMLLAAAGLSYAAGRMFDFYFILSLLFLNGLISFWQEGKANKAIEALQAKLTVTVKVLRDGKWAWLEARELVPGDYVELGVGAIVPADAALAEAKNLSVNESVLTGESLPKEKAVGDPAYSGSTVATGWARARITATGKNTYFGKTALLVEHVERQSDLERSILAISKFLMMLSAAAIVILTVFFLYRQVPFRDLVILDLSLAIAGIPIGLPTVMTLIISSGVLDLAKKSVVVRRLPALEDLANVDLLLTDKTGTLSVNQVNVLNVIPYGGYDERRVIRFAASAAVSGERSPIDLALHGEAEKFGLAPYPLAEFTPADSVRKRSTALVADGSWRILVTVGAPQVVLALCDVPPETKTAFDKDVAEAVARGERVLALAVNEKSGTEEHLALAGAFFLSDPLRPEAREVIDFMGENGIRVAMLTGDNAAIAREAARELGLAGTVIVRDSEDWKALSPATVESAAAFAEILPEDKFRIAEIAKKRHIVAMTGDGVNDLPAVRLANVGIAVSNSVDALKGAADIVLTSPGIGVIRDAFVEARKVFSRLYSYSIYRISESFRLIVTVLVLGLLYKEYPLTPIQLILLAFLNDIPIISLALNRVKYLAKPASLDLTERFALGSLFGFAGVVNSLLMFFLLKSWLGLPWDIVETAFFLKLTVSGHMLIYVAHTRERWWRFLPSWSVIGATTATQLIATVLAVTGLVVVQIPIWLAVFVWLWTFFWMQITEVMKDLEEWLAGRLPKEELRSAAR